MSIGKEMSNKLRDWNKERNEVFLEELKYRKEIVEWMADDALIIAIAHPDEATEMVLVKNPETYSILRAFSLGKDVAVSVDESEQTADNILINMFEQYAKR